ncbi:TetR/AcrR family transcriptional regulator [Compostimonas suwonensis]|uniref:AcrR family transcriptional regulator n=1 Tax=Compostimonas suwonensis TaxID=1048394 RepID=A0A2M9BTV4_9MICO|nr:TetR/AcrR family transcriptional regulator [Compostimonas suwonensis]PJJ61376.1 AcrR family transcriptional regulator [Compostimonas suwonensis]
MRAERTSAERGSAKALTPKGEATRRRIVDGAARVIRSRGVAHTSLDDVREATATSKSQLFHYFPEGKDQLLLAVAAHEADRVLDDQRPALDALDDWPTWIVWRDIVIERYRQQGRTCPLSVLVTQLGREVPEVQSIIVHLFERWQGAIERGILSMQAAGSMPASVDAASAARALLAGIQGGVVIMLATGSVEHLESAIDHSLDALRVAP